MNRSYPPTPNAVFMTSRISASYLGFWNISNAHSSQCSKHRGMYIHIERRDKEKEGRKEMFYLTTHSTHFIFGYMASDIW